MRRTPNVPLQRSIMLGLLLAFLSGCEPKYPLLMRPPPMPQDLSPAVWVAPQVVELPPPDAPPPAPAPERKPLPSEQVYAFNDYEEYTIPIRIHTPANIVLEAGEKVHAIVTGDRAMLAEGEEPRWSVKESVSASQHMPIPHIFVTATHPGLEQGIVVTTSRRAYTMLLKSVAKSPIRTVRWTYPAPQVTIPKKIEPPILPDMTQPQQFHVGYVIEPKGETPDWLPLQVIDSGVKTYITFPSTMLYMSAPLLRLLAPTSPAVVNVRQVRNVYILDLIFSHAELRVGEGDRAEVVTIRRDQLRTITCPGDPECPQWPDLRHHFAGGK